MEQDPSRGSGIIAWSALVALGFAPLLYRFGGEQWAIPHYQFFPLMILAAVFIGWQRISEIPIALRRPGGALVANTLLGLSLLTLSAAVLLWSGRAAAVGALLVLVSLAWRAGGWPILRALTPAGVLLLLVIGPPVGIGDVVLQRLREIAVWTSSRVLVWSGIVHMETGTIIEIKGQRLLVAEACSGINSMMAVLGFTLVLCFLRRRSMLHTLGLVAACVVFVLWANMVRIAGGVWLQVHYDIDLLSGAAHEWASLVLFTVCMVLVMSTDILVRQLKPLFSRRRSRRPEVQESTPVARPFPASLAGALPVTRGMWVAAALFVLLGGVQVASATSNGGMRAWMKGSGAASIAPDAFFSLPPEVAGWQRSAQAEDMLALPEIEGKRSQVWAYSNGSLTAVLAIDYPFQGYHDLTLCYRNAGWIVDDFVRSEDEQSRGYAAAYLTRLSERGYFWYSVLNEQGDWVRPPRGTLVGRIADRLERTGPPTWSAPVYQVQVWVQRYEPLTDEQRQDVRDLFLSARESLATQVLAQLRGAK